MPLIPTGIVLTLPEEAPALSAIHPSNTAAMSHNRAVRLAGAPHREGRYCSMCGKAWLARVGVNQLETSGSQCPRCGTEGEP